MTSTVNRFIHAFDRTYAWAKHDFNEWPVRFVLEIIAWIMSITNAVLLAIYAPTPPLYVMYPIWIIQCAIFAWAAWTRRSTGMVANYILLVTIDIIGFGKMLFF
jgi:hypothetical protein